MPIRIQSARKIAASVVAIIAISTLGCGARSEGLPMKVGEEVVTIIGITIYI
jgi:hypothetical protein